VYTSGYLENPLEVSRSVWEQGRRQAAPNGAVMRCSASAFVHYNDLEKVEKRHHFLTKTF
jgi:ADP-ribosylglycohydrolase